MEKLNHIPYVKYRELSESEMLDRSASYLQNMLTRRTLRDFSDKQISKEIINNCIAVANSAPSGANKQPWHFVVVTDPVVKKSLRTAAEQEEKEFYLSKAPEEWLNAIEPLGTDWHKPFLETAPCLIAVFSKSYDLEPDGIKNKNYYPMESTGIAVGFLISALHNAGLVSLTHTPSPMRFLNDILNRPKNEKPFLLLVVGYPAANATVPDIVKKGLNEVTTYF